MTKEKGPAYPLIRGPQDLGWRPLTFWMGPSVLWS